MLQAQVITYQYDLFSHQGQDVTRHSLSSETVLELWE